MMKEQIFTEKSPRPVGPYSQAIKVGNLLFLAGQIGINPQTGNLEEGLEKQAAQALENVNNIILAAGAQKSNIVRVVVYLTDLSNFSKFNSVYENFFREVDIKPVRTTVCVSSLPLNALVEIEVTAVI